MLRMDQIHVVRHKVLVEQQSVRSVSSEMGISRKTIRKYLRDPVPRRVEPKPRCRPVAEVVEGRITEIVAAWSSRTTRKQRLTGTRLQRELRAEGLAAGVPHSDPAQTPVENANGKLEQIRGGKGGTLVPSDATVVCFHWWIRTQVQDLRRKVLSETAWEKVEYWELRSGGWTATAWITAGVPSGR